jgi:hypothetical protein
LFQPLNLTSGPYNSETSDKISRCLQRIHRLWSSLSRYPHPKKHNPTTSFHEDLEKTCSPCRTPNTSTPRHRSPALPYAGVAVSLAVFLPPSFRRLPPPSSRSICRCPVACALVVLGRGASQCRASDPLFHWGLRFGGACPSVSWRGLFFFSRGGSVRGPVAGVMVCVFLRKEREFFSFYSTRRPSDYYQLLPFHSLKCLLGFVSNVWSLVSVV